MTSERRKNYVIGSSPIGDDELDTIRRIADAKSQSERKAGLVKTTDEGSFSDEVDNTMPTESIHIFNDLEKCDCVCHPRKKDCLNCYDHPTHLKKEVKLEMEPVEEKKKKHWWNR